MEYVRANIGVKLEDTIFPRSFLLFGIVLWMDCDDQVGVTYNVSVRLNLLAITLAPRECIRNPPI